MSAFGLTHQEVCLCVGCAITGEPWDGTWAEEQCEQVLLVCSTSSNSAMQCWAELGCCAFWSLFTHHKTEHKHCVVRIVGVTENKIEMQRREPKWGTL